MSAFDQLILIVESDPLTRETASAALRAAGYRTITAGNAEIALLLLRQDLPVALLMTELTSLDAADDQSAATQLHRASGDLRVVQCGRESLRPARLPAGHAFLPKPYSGSELVSVAQQLIGPPRIELP